MGSIIEELNKTIKPKEDFEPNLKDWYTGAYSSVEVKHCDCCSEAIIATHYTGGSCQIDRKLRPGLCCKHCERCYCSYGHMKPKILVENTEEIEPLTGLKSCVIYQICKAYLDTLPLGNREDPFIYHEHVDCDEPYCLNEEMDYPIMNIVDFDFHGIADSLFRKGADGERRVRSEVIQFVNDHFSISYCDSMTIPLVDRWCKDAGMIIWLFTGCGKCLK